jgi:hypothetical protein
MWFSICQRYAQILAIGARVSLIVEDESFMADAIRDGLRLEAIAADIAVTGDTALELLSINAYDTPAAPAVQRRIAVRDAA